VLVPGRRFVESTPVLRLESSGRPDSRESTPPDSRPGLPAWFTPKYIYINDRFSDNVPRLPAIWRVETLMFMTDTYTKDKQMVLAGIQPEEIEVHGDPIA